METIIIKSLDQHKINLYLWRCKNPRGIIHIFHGMREYALRYKELVNFLLSNNYSVAIHDHRGHGKSMIDEKTGFFAKKDGWDKLVYDIKILNEYLIKKFPDLDIFFLGHSMGSFVLRDAIHSLKDDIKVKGAIISGTGNPRKILVDFGALITKLLLKFNEPNQPTKLLENISFLGYDKPFKDKVVKSWLTRDIQKLNEFKKYEFAFKKMPLIFYKDLYHGIHRIIRDGFFNVKIPLLIISGSEDPVGNYSKDVAKVVEKYSKNTDVEHHFYKDMRHEVLNEINRQEVYNDIINWLNRKR